MTDASTTPIELNLSGAGRLSFKTGSAFLEWMAEEHARWNDIVSAAEGEKGLSVVAQAAVRGGRAHADQWGSWLNKLSDALQSTEEARVGRVQTIQDAVQQGVKLGHAIASASHSGGRIQGIAQISSVSACAAIALITKRLGQSARDQAIFEDVLSVVGSSIIDATTAPSVTELKMIAEAVKTADEAAAHSRAAVRETEGLIAVARRTLENAETEHSNSLSKTLSDLEEMARNRLTQIDEDWKALKSKYDSEIAFKEPIRYWGHQRLRHVVLSGIWLLIAAGLVGYALHLLPKASELLSVLHLGQKESEGGTRAFSHAAEIFGVGAVSFLFLWGLRFSVRQLAENIARFEEASQRVTMVRTFLALSQGGEGRRPLVEAADRALIVQALFRPSAHSGIDDAPPAHWVEEVLKQINPTKPKQ